MELYADALELIARALTNAVIWAVAAVLVGGAVVAITGTDWLPLTAAIAPVAPALAVAVTVRSHAAAVRERHRRAAYNVQSGSETPSPAR